MEGYREGPGVEAPQGALGYSPYAKVLVKMSVRHLRNTTLQHKFIYYTTVTWATGMGQVQEGVLIFCLAVCSKLA